MHQRPAYIERKQASQSTASSRSGLVKEFVGAGDTLTIPARYQYIVYGAFEIQDGGTVDAAGSLVVL